MGQPPKPLVWVASKKDLLELPGEVIDVFGYGLYLAQTGRKHDQAKPLKGFGSAGALELSRTGEVTRTAPSTRCVLSAASLHGRVTSEADMDLVRSRLKAAERIGKEFKL